MSKKQLYKEYIKRHKGASVIGNLNDFQKGNGTFRIIPTDNYPVSDSEVGKKSNTEPSKKRPWMKRRRKSAGQADEPTLSVSEEDSLSLITLKDTITEEALPLEDIKSSEKREKDSALSSPVKKKRRFLFFWKKGFKAIREEDSLIDDIGEDEFARTDMIIDGLMEKTTEEHSAPLAENAKRPPPLVPKLSGKEKKRAKKLKAPPLTISIPTSPGFSIPEEEDDIKTLADISEELDSGKAVNVKDVFNAIPPIGKRFTNESDLDIGHLEIICEAVEFVLAEGLEDPVPDVSMKYQVLTDIYTLAREKADITNGFLYRFIVILSRLILLETDTPISEEPEMKIEEVGREGMAFEIPKARSETFPSTITQVRKLNDFSRRELRRKIRTMRAKNETLNKKFSYITQLMRHFQKSSIEPNTIGRQIWEAFFFDYIIRMR